MKTYPSINGFWTGALLTFLVTCYFVCHTAPVHTATSDCRMVYVYTLRGKFVSLYLDDRKTISMPNPFLVEDDKYEIYTTAETDLDIRELPCSTERMR